MTVCDFVWDAMMCWTHDFWKCWRCKLFSRRIVACGQTFQKSLEVYRSGLCSCELVDRFEDALKDGQHSHVDTWLTLTIQM